MTEQRLAGKTALITGGSTGIGRATAELFAQHGARVIITGRSVENGQTVIDAIRTTHAQADFIACDVRQPESCTAAVDSALALAGTVDILFNNAGIVPFGTVLETSLQTWRDVWETNVSGTFYMCRTILPHMIGRGDGVIINNASDWALVGGQGAAAYCATKGAVAQLTRAMALDHARQGIRINAVCPGDTYVERWRNNWKKPNDFDDHLEELGSGFPLGRVGHVDEIAHGVLFLASDESSYMTGQMLVIDGGNTAGGVSAKYRTED